MVLQCYREHRLIEVVFDGVEEGFLGMGLDYFIISRILAIIRRISNLPVLRELKASPIKPSLFLSETNDRLIFLAASTAWPCAVTPPTVTVSL